MKKILMTMFAVVFAMTAFAAKSGVNVTTGDKNFFKTTTGTAVVTIDAKGATLEGEKVDENTFSELVGTATKDLCEKYTKKSKGKGLTLSASGSADYTVLVKVTKVTWSDKFFSIVPGLCTNIWGTVTVKDKSGKEVFAANIENIDGGNNPSMDRSFCDAFQALGEIFASGKMK